MFDEKGHICLIDLDFAEEGIIDSYSGYGMEQ